MVATRKAIFITGAASGIGRATARLFHSEGWFVGAHDIDAAGLATLVQELGAENCSAQRLDVADRAAFEAALAGFAALTDGKLDLLFNNAGIGRGGAFHEQAHAEVLNVVNVNLLGVLHGIQLATPLLRATPNALCLSTSSASAIYGAPWIAVYAATKHAVKGLTEALAVEYRPLGVRVADLLPGLIHTPMLQPAIVAAAPKTGMWRLVEPEEVARAVWAAYHGDKVHWYVPEELFEYDKLQTANPEAERDRQIGRTLLSPIE